MTTTVRAAMLLTLAACSLAGAILAGARAGDLRAAAAAMPPPVCCIYMIF